MAMGTDEISPIIGVDLTQQPPIHYKRTLAFVNHFITNTVRFLNKFSTACEEKLSAIQDRVQRIEVTLNILEAKLSSIPGLDEVAAPPIDATTTTTTSTTNSTNIPPAPPAPPLPGAPTSHETPQTEQGSNVVSNTASESADSSASAVPVSTDSSEPAMTVSKDPRYAKYFKMAAVGVPVPAVKNKMAAEGLNPDLIETPDAPAPPDGGGGLPPPPSQPPGDSSEDDDNVSDDNDSFSDDSSSMDDD